MNIEFFFTGNMCVLPFENIYVHNYPSCYKCLLDYRYFMAYLPGKEDRMGELYIELVTRLI